MAVSSRGQDTWFSATGPGFESPYRYQKSCNAGHPAEATFWRMTAPRRTSDKLIRKWSQQYTFEGRNLLLFDRERACSTPPITGQETTSEFERRTVLDARQHRCRSKKSAAFVCRRIA